MARMLHRRGEEARGQKVFIAVAAYEGCGAGFAYSLFHTGAALERAGIQYELAIYSGNCHVDDSRNRLTRDFLNSDCSDMVFLDADIGWNAADFIELLGYDRDVLAGIYPKKNGDDAYPVKTLPGEIWSDRDGLIEVQGVPTGFLRIRRHVMERLASEAQTYNAKNDGAYGTACIFERQIHEGTRWGGDYVFCRKARAAGFKIYIDPSMRFEHSGEETWTGCVGSYFRQRAGIGLDPAIAAIREGREQIEHMIDLYDAWGNPYAASPGLLMGLVMLAREAKGPILECGGGLSTLAMAAGMLPSALALGDGGEFRAPMAIAVIGGIIVSTVLSLVVVPSFYLIMDDLSWLLGKIFGGLVGRKEAEPEPVEPAALQSRIDTLVVDTSLLSGRVGELEATRAPARLARPHAAE